jgi:hypothetical protein
MKMTSATLGLTVLAVAEVPALYSGLLPSLWTIAHFGSTESAEAQRWIRRGELAATGLTAGVAVGIGLLANSWVPALGMATMALILLYLYEHALRQGAGAAWG